MSTSASVFFIPGHRNRLNQANNKRMYISSIVAYMRPLFITENLFGVFRFREQNGQLLEPNIIQKLCGFISVYALILIYFNHSIHNVSNILHVPVYLLVSLSMPMLYCKANIKFTNNLADIDSFLLVKIIPNQHKIFGKCLISFIILAVILIINCVCSLVFVVLRILSTDQLLYLPMDLVLYSTLFIFIEYIVMLKQRMRLLIGRLSMFHVSVGEEVTYECANAKFCNALHQQPPIPVKKMCKTFTMIIDEWILLKNTYQYFILILFIVTSIDLILIAPVIADGIVGRVVLPKYVWFFMNSSLFNRFVCWIYMAIVFCEFNQLLCNVKVLVNEVILNYEVPRNDRADAKIFLKVMQLYPMQLNICGLIDMDSSLIIYLFGTMVKTLIMNQQLQIPAQITRVFALFQ